MPAQGSPYNEIGGQSAMNPVRLIARILNRMRGRALVNGIKLPIDRSILSPYMELTLAAGRYERRERELANRIIRNGDVVLELGAGLGFIGACLRRYSGAGKIISIEANPRLIPYIRRVHSLNGIEEVEVLHGVVVPDRGAPATIPFYCRRDFWASSLDGTTPFEREVEVTSFVLSDILANHQPDVLVMDIEGGELELLAAPDLGTVRALVIETHPGAYGASGLGGLEANIARLGFREDEAGTSGKVRTFIRD